MHAVAYLLPFLFVTADDPLRVLPLETDAGKTNQSYQRYLQQETEFAVVRRTGEFEALKTPEHVAARNAKLREFLVAQLGGFPERTPLNPQIIARRSFLNFVVEKVIFESRPQHYVTALFFLPTSAGPYPGVIVPCGHTSNGKTGYQRIAAFLAQSGIAALVYDPIGQGERYQLLDEAGKPIRRSTDEHTAVGIGSILVGRNTASYRIWDGMRAIDFLQSRPEIDGTKIGCTGISGGGTLTEYLMALDERILCAAPGCAINTFARKIGGTKAGDAEQNIFGQVAFGLDHADYVSMRAPKPTLLLCATRDFVDIKGGWDVFREAKRTYARLGFSERVDLLEADEEHGFPQPLRTSSVRWMRRWLLGVDDAVTEPPFEPLTGDDVLCTPRGQAQLLNGARSVMDFNLEVADAAAAHRKEMWKPENREKALAAVRKRIGVDSMGFIPVTFSGSDAPIDREGYTIDKCVLSRPGAIDLPLLWFNPDKPGKRAVIYLHHQGKQVDAAPGGPIEQLVRDGATVVALDVRGCGETGGNGFFDAITTYLLGKTMVGGRVEDGLCIAQHFRDAEEHKGDSIELVAVGSMTVPALHLAALEPKLFQKVTLRGGMNSWLDVVRNPLLPGQLVNVVHGALLDYDLTDLVNSLPAGTVVIEDPLK